MVWNKFTYNQCELLYWFRSNRLSFQYNTSNFFL